MLFRSSERERERERLRERERERQKEREREGERGREGKRVYQKTARGTGSHREPDETRWKRQHQREDNTSFFMLDGGQDFAPFHSWERSVWISFPHGLPAYQPTSLPA